VNLSRPTRSGAGQDAGRAAVPGTGDADRHHRGGVHARGGRPAAPVAGDLQEAWAPSTPSATGSWRGCWNGYDEEFAERCFAQIEGFGEYGFPESHAASFALLVYASAWLKRHHPGIFACALLNSQPMGFYAPAQIVRDARGMGWRCARPASMPAIWDNVMEPDGRGGWRCGWGSGRSRGWRGGGALDRGRAGQRLSAVEDVWRRAGLGRADAGAAGGGRRLRLAGGDAARGAVGGEGLGGGVSRCRCSRGTWTGEGIVEPPVVLPR
jgi:hypothetical protein